MELREYLTLFLITFGEQGCRHTEDQFIDVPPELDDTRLFAWESLKDQGFMYIYFDASHDIWVTKLTTKALNLIQGE